MAHPYGVPDQFRELVGCWIAGTQPYGYRVVPYRVGTTANDMKLGIFAIKVPLLRFSLSYTLPNSTERTPTDDRENTDRAPRDQKVLFINICFPDIVTYFPKKVDSFSKKVVPFSEKLD